MKAACPLAVAALLLVPPLAVAAADGGEEPGADATKAGTATWQLLGVPINQDTGSGTQGGTKSGPYGDTSCSCKKWSFGVCQSYEGAGEYRVTWTTGRWNGRNSGATFPGSSTRAYTYSANSGWQSPCNFDLDLAEAAANSAAGFAAEHSFRTLPSGSAYGWTGTGAGVSSVYVPLSAVKLTSSGAGQWSGADASWTFQYRGNAMSGSVVVCNSPCLLAAGSSLT